MKKLFALMLALTSMQVFAQIFTPAQEWECTLIEYKDSIKTELPKINFTLAEGDEQSWAVYKNDSVELYVSTYVDRYKTGDMQRIEIGSYSLANGKKFEGATSLPMTSAKLNGDHVIGKKDGLEISCANITQNAEVIHSGSRDQVKERESSSVATGAHAKIVHN